MSGETKHAIAAVIDGAEEVCDPLDGLVERTMADPGAPFVPEVLERLVALKKDDRAAFEALRAQLKNAGCRVTALDEAIAEENGEIGGRGPTQADILIDLAQSAELFHTAGRYRLRRPRHQRPPGNLADPRQGLSPLAGAPLLRGDAGRAEFGGVAIGAQRDRGQGPFRCARTHGPCPRRRTGRAALPRPWRRDLAGGGDRRHRLASDRQSAGAVSPRRRDAASAGAGGRRIDRDAALLPQCAVG